MGALRAVFDIVDDGVARANIRKLLNREQFQESVKKLNRLKLTRNPARPSHNRAGVETGES